MATNKHSGVSITGLVTGIASLALFWFPIVHLILGTLAIIFAGIALSRKERFGLAGLICGVMGFVIGWGYLLIAMVMTLGA